MNLENTKVPCESNGTNLEVLNDGGGKSLLDIFDWSSVDSIGDMSR